MKEQTLEKCRQVVKQMLEYNVGMKKATDEYNVSLGSVHNYIHNILKHEDLETYDRIINDMNKRYKKGR